jgi:UDP-glucose 4-epimerase
MHGGAVPTSLITGGAGFIGSHVTDALIARGHRTIVLDDLSGGIRDNVNPAAELHVGSCTDVRLVDDIFRRNQIDYVFHLAAYAAEGLSHFIRHFNYSTNIVGSVALINAAVNAGHVKAFVFTSSIAVYGAAQTPMREDMEPRPEDPYGIAKYAIELDLAAAHRMFGLDFIVFRPHNVYGERQNHADPYRNVIAIFIGQVLRGEPCTIFGDGLQTRAFSHVDDIAPIIAASVDNPRALNEVFNLGAGASSTVLELAQSIQREMGSSTGIVHLPARNEVVHAFADHEKARDVLGFQSTISLADGLERTITWLRHAKKRPPVSLPAVEVSRNLPSAWRSIPSG